MHELSLARSLLDEVDAIAARHPGSHVTEVRVSVGRLSGVEPSLLACAVQRLFPERGHGRARLVVDSAELLACCERCAGQFVVRDLVLRCPVCRGGRVRILRGDALVLESVQLCGAEGPESDE